MKPETLGEVNIMFQNLLTEVQALSIELKANTTLSHQIHGEVKKTNGRMNIVEPLALDYQMNRERIKGAVTFASIIGVAVIGSFILLGKLYIDKTKQDITKGIIQTLENNYTVKIQ